MRIPNAPRYTRVTAAPWYDIIIVYLDLIALVRCCQMFKSNNILDNNKWTMKQTITMMIVLFQQIRGFVDI